jgi:membrane protease YdiL (CAAX protease family)
VLQSGRVTVQLARPRVLRNEVLLVLGVSLGASAVYSVVSLLAKLTAAKPLSEQTATLNASQAPDRPWLDLTYQLLGIFFALVPVLLAVHLLNRDHNDVGRLLGLDRRRPLLDLRDGAVLAAIIGIPGLGVYYAGHALGVTVTVQASGLPDVWWKVPVLVLSAAQNAALEEVVVVGYLITRLREIGWETRAAIAGSAVLRGSYHLYQGFGSFVGNAIMGVVFAYFFTTKRRLLFLGTGRVLPLVVAHTLLDVVAFVGYDLLHDRFSWL